ncbi:putative Protein phosphatase 2C [Fusarium oxysporum f. sp. albedinis]|nr:putative Protein phosphatase 2C [Fusarium oxysporum f. sp. albedinis]
MSLQHGAAGTEGHANALSRHEPAFTPSWLIPVPVPVPRVSRRCDDLHRKLDTHTSHSGFSIFSMSGANPSSLDERYFSVVLTFCLVTHLLFLFSPLSRSYYPPFTLTWAGSPIEKLYIN